MQERTRSAMLNPKQGDLYSEFLSYWVLVLDVQENLVYYATRASESDWEYFKTNKLGFQKRFGYGGLVKGYWITYHSNKQDLAHKLLESCRVPYVEEPVIRPNKVSQVVI